MAVGILDIGSPSKQEEKRKAEMAFFLDYPALFMYIFCGFIHLLI